MTKLSFKDRLELHYDKLDRQIEETPFLRFAYKVAKIFRKEIHERKYSTGWDCSLNGIRKGQPVLTSLWYTPHVTGRVVGTNWVRWWLIKWDDGKWEWYPSTFFRNRDSETGIRYRMC